PGVVRPAGEGRQAHRRRAEGHRRGALRRGRDDGGGRQWLLDVLREHAGAVRADLQRYYPGRRLEEFWAMSWGEGSMNWAELRDLVTALPEDSATKAALAGDVEGRRWDSATFLAAAQYNA